jgi:cysteine desulfurase
LTFAPGETEQSSERASCGVRTLVGSLDPVSAPAAAPPDAAPTVTYLDHAATTPMRPEAIEAMLPYLRGDYANPSGSHRFAQRARRAVDEARDRVAAVVGCHPNEVVFTGGGTESDNTAVAGAISRSGGVAVCSAIEHPAVLEVVHRHDGIVVGVDRCGGIVLEELETVLRQAASDDRPVAIVSVMTVNNEVGSINDIASIARVVRRHAPGALLHTDAVQAACWLDLREITPHIDLLSLSAHKFGGPKGVGVLVERGGPRVDALIIGGGQERERRSGTHNTAGIVAAATALELTDGERVDDAGRIAPLRDDLVDRLCGEIDGCTETVRRDRKVVGSAHVCIEGLESEALLFLLDEAGVCASAASSCASGAMEPSHVLAAMGVPRERALGALRLTLGHETTGDEAERAAQVVIDAVARLRR